MECDQTSKHWRYCRNKAILGQPHIYFSIVASTFVLVDGKTSNSIGKACYVFSPLSQLCKHL